MGGLRRPQPSKHARREAKQPAWSWSWSHGAMVDHLYPNPVEAAHISSRARGAGSIAALQSLWRTAAPQVRQGVRAIGFLRGAVAEPAQRTGRVFAVAARRTRGACASGASAGLLIVCTEQLLTHEGSATRPGPRLDRWTILLADGHATRGRDLPDAGLAGGSGTTKAARIRSIGANQAGTVARVILCGSLQWAGAGIAGGIVARGCPIAAAAHERD